MANPQKENGFTGFSNELLESIVKYPFSGQELRLILKVARETYGWSRKKAQISYGEISRSTGIARRSVIRLCQGLVERKILFFQETAGERAANLMGVNKNYEDWLLADKSGFINAGDGGKVDTIGLNNGGNGDTSIVSRMPLAVSVASVLGDTMLSVMCATTSKKVNKIIALKKAGNKARLKDSSDNPERKKTREVAALLDGFENCIGHGVNPIPLVNHFAEAGYDIKRVWGAVIQARAGSKKKPAGFFVKAIANPNFAISDTAMQQVGAEMRQYNF